MVEGTIADLGGRVADGSLHVALLFQDASEARREHPGLRRHDLLVEPFVAVVGPNHRLAKRRTIRVWELAGDPWTAPSTTGILHSACVAAGFEPDLRFITSDVLAILAVIATDLAVTLSPRLIAGHLHDVRIIELRNGPPRR